MEAAQWRLGGGLGVVYQSTPRVLQALCCSIRVVQAVRAWTLTALLLARTRMCFVISVTRLNLLRHSSRRKAAEARNKEPACRS